MIRKKIYLLTTFILLATFITVISYLAFGNKNWLLSIGFITITISTIFAFWIFISNRNSHAKMSWIITVYALPLVGVIIFIIFGQKYYYTRNQDYYLKKYESLYNCEDWTFSEQFLNSPHNKLENKQLICSTNWSKRPVYNNTKISILNNGVEKYTNLFEDLNNAQEYININYFILYDGIILEQITNILIEKSYQGVKIRIIYDHGGSFFTLIYDTIHKMKKAGILVKKFSSVSLPFIRGKNNYRNHRKDIIIDGKIAYTGGMNIGDNYAHLSSYGLWRDTHLRLEGNAVRSMELIFMQDWYFITGEDLSFDEKLLQTKPYSKRINNSIVQVIDDGPNIEETIQKDILIKFISSAKKRIWLSTPYLVLTQDLMIALSNAAKSNVDVRIVMPGLTDKLFVLDLSRSYYEALLKVGVKIYELNDTFNHSKTALFDDELFIVGTTNLDLRSFYQDYQTFIIVYDQSLTSKLEKNYLWDFEHSRLINLSPLKKKNWFYRLFFLTIMKIISPLF